MEEKFQLLRRDYQGFFPRLSLYVRIIKSGKRFCAFIPRRKVRTVDVVLPNRSPSFNFQTSPLGEKNQINRAKRRGNPIHSRVYRETSRTVINNYRVKRVKWIFSDSWSWKPRSTASNLSRKIAWKLILVYNRGVQVERGWSFVRRYI